MNKKLFSLLLVGIDFFLFSQIENPIVIIVASYNNKDWYRKNLDSIFEQKYSNYRVIYINDASPDGTGKLVVDYIKEKGIQEKITLIDNSIRYTALPNLYSAIHSCKDDDVIALLDGDDWFANDQVLSIINKAYCDKNIWLTYGSCQDLYEDGFTYPCADVIEKINENIRNTEQIDDRRLRGYFVPGHLITFYAWLFKEIKLKDLLFNGKIASISYDVAINYPLFEMARNHIQFIPEITYIHNLLNQLNDHKVAPQYQTEVCEEFLKRKEYPRLHKPCASNYQQSSISVIIFQKKRYKEESFVDSCIKQLQDHISSIRSIIVINEQALNEKNAQVKRQELITALQSIPDKYVLLLFDDVMINKDINVQLFADLLEQTKAHSFSLRNFTLNQRSLDFPHENFFDKCMFYQVKNAQNEWRHVYNFDGTIYNREELLDIFGVLIKNKEKDLLRKFIESRRRVSNGEVILC